jgi:predicted protein tyrosine phosphatase
MRRVSYWVSGGLHCIATSGYRLETLRVSRKFRSSRQALNPDPLKLLFICSRNQWRSRTAEEIFRNTPGWSVRSAGTSEQARIRVSEKLLLWADVVFVMEKRHAEILRERFPEASAEREIVCLQILDDYEFMDEALVALLRAGVEEYFSEK